MFQDFQPGPRSLDIEFIGHDQPWPLGELIAVQADFGPQGSEVVPWLPSVARGHVEHKKQDATAHDVTEKLMTEATIGVSPFDETRNIRHRGPHEAGVFDDPDHRLESRKGISGNFRTRGAQRGDEAGFSGIGKSDHAGVGDFAQFEEIPSLLTGLTGLCFGGGSVG